MLYTYMKCTNWLNVVVLFQIFKGTTELLDDIIKYRVPHYWWDCKDCKFKALSLVSSCRGVYWSFTKWLRTEISQFWLTYKEPWMWENGLNKVRTVVSEVSCFVGNSVHWLNLVFLNPQFCGSWVLQIYLTKYKFIILLFPDLVTSQTFRNLQVFHPFNPI